MTNTKEIEEFVRLLEKHFGDKQHDPCKNRRENLKEDPDLPEAVPLEMVTETFSGLLVNGHEI